MMHFVACLAFAVCDIAVHFSCDRASCGGHVLDHWTLLKITSVCPYLCALLK